jgi:hypothetical protein
MVALDILNMILLDINSISIVNILIDLINEVLKNFISYLYLHPLIEDDMSHENFVELMLLSLYPFIFLLSLSIIIIYFRKLQLIIY